MKEKIIGVILTIVLSLVIVAVAVDKRTFGQSIEAYQVYLSGEKIGLIGDKEELYNLIDSEQLEIKKQYDVDKVYPPKDLSVKKVYTYSDKLSDVKSIYEVIREKGEFTIEGYVATIIYTEEKVENDNEVVEPAPPVKLYMMEKSFFEDALYNTASAFIGTEDLVNYKNNTQAEIVDTGEVFNSVYFEETLTIKKDLINSKNYIFRSSEELSRYLLFGTLEDQKSYTTKAGENLEAIADANNLNIEELLIANPQYGSADVLLTEGEKINVGLIAPLVSVVYRKTIVDDVSIAYKTEYVNDSTKYKDYEHVTQEGQNGVMRITQDVIFTNGEIQSLQINQRETIKESVNKIITRGTKSYSGENIVHQIGQGNATWSWPTLSPYVITSKFKWRWGRQHQGIDISGCGYGSPIFAVKEGLVYKINTNPSKAEGLSVYIDHGNGYVTQYMHLAKILVSSGQTVKKEQKIGLMGKSGVVTGTHLHLGVWLGKPYEGGTVLDPCKSIFSC